MNLTTLDTVVARTLLVLIVGLGVSHALSVALYSTDRSDAVGLSGAQYMGDHIATIYRLVEGASPSERRRMIDLANGPTVRISLTSASAVADSGGANPAVKLFREALSSRLGDSGGRVPRLDIVDQMFAAAVGVPSADIAPPGHAVPALLASLQLPDGSWLNVVAPLEPPESMGSLRFVLSLAVMLLAVGALSVLVVQYLTRPLQVFSDAAQRLGRDVRAPPLPESGPLEVRQATAAFNEMQKRIRRFVEDRTQMIAAISHDLGTPITRLRLRAEFIEDEEQQSKMLADLGEMEKMVFSTLAFVRNEVTNEPRTKVEIRTLLQRVCDGIADAGYRVELETGAEARPYDCRPAALRRALANIIENAAKYGYCAHVSLLERESELLIRVEDEGPGIPDAYHEQIFEPFRRLDISRNRETGGVGLGLTVARSIIRAHGGRISLENRAERGLRVDVCLPN